MRETDYIPLPPLDKRDVGGNVHTCARTQCILTTVPVPPGSFENRHLIVLEPTASLAAQ